MPYKKADVGSWNHNITYRFKGGQGMKFVVSNVNVLGTTLTIEAHTGETHSRIIGPLQTAEFEYSLFTHEPTMWSFEISTESDAFTVSWILYATWVEGDPPNPR